MADSAVTQEDLIARMDPDRDYGKRGYEGAKTEVRRGLLVLSEAPDTDLPVIRTKARGVMVDGTARPNRPHAGSTAAGQRLSKRLVDFMEQDGGEEMAMDIIYETLSLKNSAKYDIPWKSRVDMVVFINERISGRPQDARPPVEDALIRELLSRMQAGTLNEDREIPQLPGSREVELTTTEVE